MRLPTRIANGAKRECRNGLPTLGYGYIEGRHLIDVAKIHRDKVPLVRRELMEHNMNTPKALLGMICTEAFESIQEDRITANQPPASAPARSPARIDRIMELLWNAWTEHPNLSLCQLLEGIVIQGKAVFVFEDEELEQVLGVIARTKAERA